MIWYWEDHPVLAKLEAEMHPCELYNQAGNSLKSTQPGWHSSSPHLLYLWRTDWWRTSDIEVIGPACPIPVRISPSNVEDIIPYIILDARTANSRVMSQPCDREGHKEQICLSWILCDEVALHEALLEVTFTGVITTRLKATGRENISEGIVPPVRINIYLKAPIHFSIVFLEDISVMVHVVVIHMVAWTIRPKFPNTGVNTIRFSDINLESFNVSSHSQQQIFNSLSDKQGRYYMSRAG